MISYAPKVVAAVVDGPSMRVGPGGDVVDLTTPQPSQQERDPFAEGEERAAKRPRTQVAAPLVDLSDEGEVHETRQRPCIELHHRSMHAATAHALPLPAMCRMRQPPFTHDTRARACGACASLDLPLPSCQGPRQSKRTLSQVPAARVVPTVAHIRRRGCLLGWLEGAMPPSQSRRSMARRSSGAPLASRRWAHWYGAMHDVRAVW